MVKTLLINRYLYVINDGFYWYPFSETNLVVASKKKNIEMKENCQSLVPAVYCMNFSREFINHLCPGAPLTDMN